MIQDKYIIWAIIIIIVFFALYKNIKKEERLSNLLDKEIKKKPLINVNKKNTEKIEISNDKSNDSIDSNGSSIRYTYIYDKIDYTNYDGYRNDEKNRDRKRQVRFNLDNNTFHE
jgi:hypothetical protein